MRQTWLVAVALLFSVLAPAATAQTPTQKRVALVVGNSAYRHTSALANPKHDAADVAAALKALGFRVLDGLDLDKASFDRKVRDFAGALQGADIGLFFFAGHGLQVDGHNYLVPVDAQLSSASALDFEMMRLDLVQRTMEREAQTNLLFLDACRDNPLARSLARSMGTRSTSVGRGLAVMEGGVGTLISYSTQPGSVALDGEGRNSPFTQSLLRHVSSSSEDLSAVLIEVRKDVMAATRRQQVPWEHSALTGRFFFKPRGAVAATAQQPAQPPSGEAERAWEWAKDTTSIAALEAFVRRFQDTYYGDLARVRIEELKRTGAGRRKTDDAGPLDLAGTWIGWVHQPEQPQLGEYDILLHFETPLRGRIVLPRFGCEAQISGRTLDGRNVYDQFTWIKNSTCSFGSIVIARTAGAITYAAYFPDGSRGGVGTLSRK